MLFYGPHCPPVRSELKVHFRVHGLVLIVFIYRRSILPYIIYLKTEDYLWSGSKKIPVFSQISFREVGENATFESNSLKF